MLLLRVRRNLLPLLRAASPLPSPIHHCACFLSVSPAPSSFEDYLAAACGLTPAQAHKTAEKAFEEASKVSMKAFEELSFSRVNSAFNPDAVLAVLRGVGLSRADIASVVAADPLLLRSSVKRIEPRLLALRDRVGLSPPQIARLLLVGSRALRRCNVDAKVEFLISFFGSFEQFMVVAKKNTRILTASIEKLFEPNISLLRQSGVQGIAQLCLTAPWLLTYRPERVHEFLQRAKELGVPPTSPMFKHVVSAIASNSKEKVAARLELFERTLGCSRSEVYNAVPKMPYSVLNLSDESLLRKIKFLVNEVGMGRQYILERPVLLGLSLEKRLMPRHYVMKVLQAKGLLHSNMSLFTFAVIGEKNFRLKFIDCHENSVPGLADGYAAARAGVVPLRS